MDDAEHKQNGATKGLRKLFLVTLALMYGYGMLMAFVLVPDNFGDLLHVTEHMPWYAAASVEVVAFIQSFWWAISLVCGGLGFVGFIGLLPGLRLLIVTNILASVLLGCVTYAVRNAGDLAVEHTKDKAIEGIKDRVKEFLED